jgi:bifunctional DNA primase/polymerase-like protein
MPEYASAAAARGWHVFPVLPGDKAPAVGQWEQRARCNPAGIRKAFEERYPGHNIGIACGPSGLVVLDLDNHGQLPADWAGPGMVDGQDVLATLAERAGQAWPWTYTVATPSGGVHLYFSAPAGSQIRNSAGKLGPMVDVRGQGGYVVGAGSQVNGVSYRPWDEDFPVAPLPAWLLALLCPPVRSVRSDLMPGQGPETFGQRGVRMSEWPSGLHPPRYAQAALEGELAKVISAAEGTRNITLNNAALALGQFCAAGELPTMEVAGLLADAAQAAGLPAREAAATIASGMKAARPRSCYEY